jgi:hypothetical protein
MLWEAYVREDHAADPVSGVPLLGIPPAAVLEECDDCHEWFGLRTINLDFDGHFRCPTHSEGWFTLTEGRSEGRCIDSETSPPVYFR